jgi:hypothetical protein
MLENEAGTKVICSLFHALFNDAISPPYIILKVQIYYLVSKEIKGSLLAANLIGLQSKQPWKNVKVLHHGWTEKNQK